MGGGSRICNSSRWNGKLARWGELQMRDPREGCWGVPTCKPAMPIAQCGWPRIPVVTFMSCTLIFVFSHSSIVPTNGRAILRPCISERFYVLAFFWSLFVPPEAQRRHRWIGRNSSGLKEME